MTEANVRIAHAYLEAFGAHDPEAMDALLDAAYEGHDMGLGDDGVYDRAAEGVNNQALFNAFPDARVAITLTVAQGDHVVAHWTATGTHSGGLEAPSGIVIAATGKAVTVHVCSTMEIRDGRIRRAWHFWDLSSLSSFFF